MSDVVQGVIIMYIFRTELVNISVADEAELSRQQTNKQTKNWEI